MYTALYRKWRPMTFDDVVSQPHITTTLSNQIKEGKTAHAYLFTGSRGTGKTTCARIFAKAVNCRNPQGGRPCLQCDICRAADSGTLNDIIEIDAASNTGVEDIRDLRESTIYTPELAKYKIYIIDEVHMLSNQAFNALLKIMEEPPEHVKFILATTEIHKVPATIISRCQRFDFRRIRQEDITARLLYIASQENVRLSDDAAATIARISDGAMRDALSLLDQCIAISDDITLSTVSEAAGIAGKDAVFDILDGIAGRDAAKVLALTDTLYSMSKDMARLCDELIFQLRNMMLIKTAPENKELLNCLPDETEKLISIAQKLSIQDILRNLEILQSAMETMQRAVSKRTEFEMAIVKICCGSPSVAISSAADNPDITELQNKIAFLEKELNAIKAGSALPVRDKAPKDTFEKAEKQTAPANGAKPVSEEMLKPFPGWEDVLDNLQKVNPGCASALRGSKGLYFENTLLIEVQSDFALKTFKMPQNAASLKSVVESMTGKSYSLRARSAKESRSQSSDSAEDKLKHLMEQAKKADIPFDIE